MALDHTLNTSSTNATERQCRVFRHELVRRLANDCVDAMEHTKRHRPDVTLWVAPIASAIEGEVYASIGVAVGTEGNRREWRAYVSPGEGRDEIVASIGGAIKYAQEQPTAA